MNETIWLSTPHMSGKELRFIHDAFEKNHVFPLGPNVIGFEQDLENYTGAGFCTCLSSGTAAIHLALIILGIKPGDEVLCSSLTFCASANPIVYLGAQPVFIDSEETTWNIDPHLLEQAIKDRIKKGKKPKAIIAVHLYGMPARIDEIMQISNYYEIPVIEDAAEALGSSYKGKKCGSFGDIGILSFNGNKIITTSGGGAFLSDNKNFCEKALFLATQARDKAPHYQHSEIGYNYRMSNICAGIGRGQMEVLQERIKNRRENFFFYKNAFRELEGITLLEEPNDYFYSNHWLTTILIEPEKTNGITTQTIQKVLSAKNVETRPLWKPMHLQPVFKSSPFYLNGVAENLFNKGLCLPSSSSLTNEARSFVAQSIIDLIKN